MNAKSRVRVLYAENVIEFNAVFANMMTNPMSDEYALLQNLRQDNPTFVVRKRCINKNASQEHFRGLTYEYMREYILTHEAAEDAKVLCAELDELICISQCHSASKRYPVIKRWFLKKYPSVKEFGVLPSENDRPQDDAPEVIARISDAA